jgi:hypothetical protein
LKETKYLAIFKYLTFKYMQNKTLFHINNKIIDIFYLADEFCKEFDITKKGRVLYEKESKKTRNRKFILSDSEVITILTVFHLSQTRCIKSACPCFIWKGFPWCFPVQKNVKPVCRLFAL